MKRHPLPLRAASLLLAIGVGTAAGCSTTGDDPGPGDADGVGPADGPELVGDEWLVETIAGRTVMADTSPSIGFSGDGNVFGDASCNRIVGTWEREGDMLDIGPLGTTMMACPDELAGQERALLVQLGEVDRLEFDETGALVLMAPDGSRIVARRR